MAERFMYVVTDEGTVPAKAVSLAHLQFREVQDLEEWIVTHPEVLGPDVKIVATEFDRWQTEGGNRARERLDVLALESSGRLIVAELKRESDANIHVQAITYAALVSGFTEETLAHAHADYLTRRGNPVNHDQALARLREELEVDFDPDVLSNPRIVLIARDFPPQVVTTVEWLSNRNIDITLMQVQAWQVQDQIAVTFDQLYPVVGVGDVLLTPARRRVAMEQEKVANTARLASATKIIRDEGLLSDGAPLTFKATNMKAELRQAAEDWVAEDIRRGQAQWRIDDGKPLEWAHDGQRYSPTGLVKRILLAAAGQQPVVAGPRFWVTDGGLTLAELAFGDGLRDWSDLHSLIAAVHPGEWTTYGDLGSVIGLPAQPVGTHIATCSECPEGAHRVLTANGRPSEGFRWTDPNDMRSAREVLESEGLDFDETGRADEDVRLAASELRERQYQASATTSKVDV